MCSKTELNPPFTRPALQLSTRELKKIQFFGICSSLSFLFWFIALIVIQISYAVHTHTQFNKIGKQSYANDCSS